MNICWQQWNIIISAVYSLSKTQNIFIPIKDIIERTKSMKSQQGSFIPLSLQLFSIRSYTDHTDANLQQHLVNLRNTVETNLDLISVHCQCLLSMNDSAAPDVVPIICSVWSENIHNVWFLPANIRAQRAKLSKGSADRWYWSIKNTVQDLWMSSVTSAAFSVCCCDLIY